MTDRSGYTGVQMGNAKIRQKDINRVFYDIEKDKVIAFILVAKKKLVRVGNFRGHPTTTYDLSTAKWKRDPEGDIN